MDAGGDDRGRRGTREALDGGQGGSLVKTHIEIPVMLQEHSLFTKCNSTMLLAPSRRFVRVFVFTFQSMFYRLSLTLFCIYLLVG